MPFPSPDAALATAVDHHRAGRLPQAEQIYREILAADPNHPGALNLLGALAHQVGKSDAGVQLISRAIQCGAGPDAYNNLGECLRALGRMNEAVAAYQTAIRLAPDFPDPYSNFGLLLHRSGRFAEALPLLEKAIALNPNFVHARYTYGLVLSSLNRQQEAVDQWEIALRLAPNDLLTLNALGAALIPMDRLERAILYLRRGVELAPNFAEGHANLGHALVTNGQFEEGIKEATRAVELEPNRAEAHNTLGLVLLKAQRYEEAIHATKKALQLHPNYHRAQGNLGAIYQQMDRRAEAIEAFEAALKMQPTDINTLTALYGSYFRAHQPEKALEISDRAIQAHPNYAEFHGNRALALLAMGRYQEAWEEYEWRWNCKSFTSPPRDFDRPMWDGSDPAGRTILVHGEQGFGDVIQFTRYVPLLVARGAKVICEVQSTLRTLFQFNWPEVRTVPKGLKLPDFDWHVPLMSLPRAFATTLETIPQNIPYLRADPERIEKWRPRMQGGGVQGGGMKIGGLKIGLIWGGNKKPDPKRTCPLKELAPLMELPNISWFSLQTGEHRADLNDLPADWNLPDLGGDFKDFSDTAAAMSLLDVVLTIDTSAAHLAGAMGLKTWVMLPYAADWRWQREGETTPWYPAVKLFRQSEPGAWEEVVGQVKSQLIDAPRRHGGHGENLSR